MARALANPQDVSIRGVVAIFEVGMPGEKPFLVLASALVV